MKFLIVDDEMTYHELMKYILKDHGDVETADDGKEAIEKFKPSTQKSELFKFVFLNIQMPQMDGHQVLRSIRAIENERLTNSSDRTKVVMMSRLDDTENVISALEDGCNHYLVKPFSFDKVTELIKTP